MNSGLIVPNVVSVGDTLSLSARVSAITATRAESRHEDAGVGLLGRMECDRG